jgi:nucleotide-binding universal stress UspA family protein
MKKMDLRIIRDMCQSPYQCVKCNKQLCALVDRGNDYECIVDKHHSTPEGLVCEACYAAEKEGRITEPYRKKILLAVDGSDGSLEAVRHVAKHVSPKRAYVLLLHVEKQGKQTYSDARTHALFREQTADIVELDGIRRRAMQAFMDQARQILLDAGFPEEAVRAEIREKHAGVVADIVEESQKGYTTIVVGRKGRSKLRDAVLGNVTARLLQRKVKIPVWVI